MFYSCDMYSFKGTASHSSFGIRREGLAVSRTHSTESIIRYVSARYSNLLQDNEEAQSHRTRLQQKVIILLAKSSKIFEHIKVW